MKKLSFLLIVLMIKTLAFSQNPSIVPDNVPGAFVDYIYTSQEVLKTTEKYKLQAPQFSIPTNNNNTNKQDLDLDIYYTALNTKCFGLKPLIVFAPGAGMGKEAYEFIARDLVRRGYIVAAITVRNTDIAAAAVYAILHLANPNIDKKVNPGLIYTAAMDLHISIKYLTIQRAATYGIDPNYVIVGGGSLGAATALQAAFMDKAEADAQFGLAVSPELGVNLDVNDAYFDDYDPTLQTTKIKGVVSLYGAVYNTTFISPTESTPVFLFHGNIDPNVPYRNNTMYYKSSDVFVFGSSSIATTLQNNGSSYCFITGIDVGHTYKPMCSYLDESFPMGYPMNWYPDMLSFLKNSVLCNRLNQTSKVINCTLANGCDPTNVPCRVVDGNTSHAPNLPANSTPVVLPSLPTSACQSTTTNQHCHAFSFDGGDYVKIVNYPSMVNPNKEYTVEFWFKKTAVIANNVYRIMFESGGQSAKSGIIDFGFKGESNLYINTTGGPNGDPTEILIPVAIDQNWHHYKLYYNAPSLSVSLKMDNNLLLPATSVSYFDIPSNFTTTFGGTYSPFGNGSIGQMDEVKIWKGITAFNTNSTNSTNICPNQTDLLAYYKLNADGQTVLDQTNNHYNGIKGLSLLADAADPTYVTNCNTSARMANTNANPVVEPTKTTVVNEPIKIKEEKEVLDIFPNPSENKPNILFLSNNEGVCSFEIVDIKGSVLISKQNIVLTKGMNIFSNYLPNLASGMYIAKIHTEYNHFEQKFAITK